MDISSVNSDLIRGNVTTIILGCLLSEDRYGYEIMKEIEDKSNSQYVLKQATLYNQLKRLEKQGLVTSYDGAPDDTGGGKRRYYSLTPEGKAFLLKEKSEYEYSRTILDKLVSEKEFDFTNDIPFDASELRPYAKRESQETKVVYKDKIVEKPIEVEKLVEVEKVVEVEKLVEVEKPLYFDTYGNQISQEQLEDIKAKALQDEENARKTDEELRQANENLLIKEEQLRKSEEDKELVKTLLRSLQEEKLRNEEILKRKEDEENARLEQERLAREKEEAERIEKQNTPSQTLEEMFAKLEAESEYKRAVKQEEVQEHTYVNAYSNQPTQTSQPQSSLRDIFKKLDEKEAEIDDRLEKEVVYEQLPIEETQNITSQDYLHSELESRKSFKDTQYSTTSAVVNRHEDGFEYERDDVNYRDFFYSIAADNVMQDDTPKQPAIEYQDSDIKTRLYAKGFKIRPYDRGNTSEYYTFNFLQSNRINRDTFLTVLAFFVVELAIMWASLSTKISYVYFLPILLCGSALCLVPTVLYLSNPTKRKRANFNFKLSILNRSMMFIEISVVCILIGFFALGASVNDTVLILQAIVVPIVLLTNIPLSSLIYWLLYRTRKYHIA